MTDQAPRPPARRRFPALDEDPERPRTSRRWWLVVAVAGVVATVVTVAVVLTQTSSGHSPHVPSPPAALRLPAAARPLPGATGGDAESFGVLGPAGGRPHLSRRQALQRYDRSPGSVSRRGSQRRLLTALVRAAFINGGQVRQGIYWVVSVWFHPPDIGVSPQHQWCVDHVVLSATTGRYGGSVKACLTRGHGPRPVH